MIAKVNFLSLNIGMKNNLAELPTLVRIHELDLIFLQEIRLSEKQIEQAGAELGQAQPRLGLKASLCGLVGK